MKKLFLQTICIMSAFCSVVVMQAMVKKPWTFLVYLAAANDLNSLALLDLHDMMRVGSNANVNIIVYLTVQEEGKEKQTKKLYIHQGSLTQIGETMVRDSGDISTLSEALHWANVDYPSDHIAIVLWGNGSGSLNRSLQPRVTKGVCYDFDTEHYLTDRDCLLALSWGRDYLRGGKKYDIIAFDACFLASLEMAYTFASCADYMVASEETVPSDGYQYARMLNQFATKNCDPLSFAKLMVSTYKQEYFNAAKYTLSVIDLNALQPLVDNCNVIAQILTSQLNGKDSAAIKTIIKKCTNTHSCSSFDQGIYIDLCQFYKNLLKNIAGLQLSKSIVDRFRQILINGIQLCSSIIKANVMSSNYKQVGGLSIYFPRYSIDPSYYGLYWVEKNPNWLDFLEAYLV